MSRTRLSTGSLPSPQLERFATSRAFVQQIDVVFPSRIARDDVFTSLETSYSIAQFTLSDLHAHASRLATPDAPFKAVPLAQRDADDTWCIDPRGVLTLCVSKTLYEQLGLVGSKLPFKGCPDRYVMRVPLRQETTSVAVGARQRAALGVWDRLRANEGLGRWRVAYVGGASTSASSASVDAPVPEAHPATDVTPLSRRAVNVYVPHVVSLVQSTDETAEDHRERLEALFEWVGMACLGAQRRASLRAIDRVDPYVAVYEAPSPNAIDDVTHVRWRGLMDGAFVRSVIDTVISTLEASGDSASFVSIAVHSNLAAPVSYLPESPTKEAPPRVPGLEAEDTACLLLSKSSTKSTFAIVESIGKWDARWG